MMRVLYLDVLILLNAIIDYFALKLSCVLCGKHVKNIRIAAAGAVGGFLSMMILLDISSTALSFLLKLLSSAAISVIAVGLREIRSTVKITISLFIISMLICGAVGAVSRLSRHNVFLNNYFIYLGVSPITLLLALALSYALISALESFFPEIRFRDTINLEIEIRGNSARFKALVDSGNLLQSTVDGKKVIIIDSSVGEALISATAVNMLSNPEKVHLLISQGYHIRFVPYSTIDGSGTMVGICCNIHTLSDIGIRKSSHEMVAVFRDLSLGREDIGAIIGKIT